MNMLTRIILAILAFYLVTPCYAYIVDGSRISHPRLLSYAKEKLQNQGTLQQTSDGFTYLKVSDKYISELIKQVARPGFELPTAQISVDGAHIAVIQGNEAKNIKLLELGQTVNFKPLGFYTIVQHDKEYFMLAVEAPDLAKLRKKYGLTAQPDNHAFNITIGVRQLVAENELAGSNP
jgi:hypothetical protein